MSEQVTTAVPDAIAKFDPAEIEKFKRRFAAGRAMEIEKANTALGTIDEKIVNKTADIESLTKTADKLGSDWKSRETARLKKSKPGDPTQNEIKAKKLADDEQDKLTTAKSDLVDLEGEKVTAQGRLKQAPRDAYNEKSGAIVKRLPRGTKVETVDPGVGAALKSLMDDRKYDEIDARLLEFEDKVLAVVAGRDLPKLHASMTSRLETLKKQPVKNTDAQKEIGQALAAVDPAAPTGPGLARLERRTGPALAAAEAEVIKVLDVMRPLDAEIALLQRNHPAKLGDHRTEFGKCANVAKHGDPDEALRRLALLGRAVAATQKEIADQATAATIYPTELAALRQRLTDFAGLSESHAGYGSGVRTQTKRLDEAAEFATEGEFIGALNIVRDADARLDEWEDAADQKEAKRLAAIGRADADRQRREAETRARIAREARERAEQQAAEAERQRHAQAIAANTTASLDAIGKTDDFDVWMDKVNTLRQAALLALSFSDAYWLAGNTTVEIEVDVTGSGDGFVDFFVVHYHPVSDGIGSQVHTKPYTGNMTTPRDRRLNNAGHWMFQAGAPSLGDIQRDFQ